ncbi:MAG TPA: allophanate hydrolase, partial [Polyangia bacterium]|nr:allophanate hydrolase [Polyangia bacterium]
MTATTAEKPARPVELAERALDAIARRGADGVWISVTPADALMNEARALERRHASGEPLPLYGQSFAVKDNIDVAGLPTTAACPALATTPARHATVVARLIRAGALCVGKTNLDQLATGLTGVRSPYGIPRNPFDERYVVGGSSSGSAVAVAVGLVDFALGTDTAGSGRVPAAFNNIVGLKPSRGLFSAAGVVPACPSLDCVSIFSLTVEDAQRVADLARGTDDADPFSRPEADAFAFSAGPRPPRFRFGVPAGAALDYRGDAAAADVFARTVARVRALGGEPVELDFTPFREAGALVYEGAYVAERLIAGGDLLNRDPEALLAPIRTILTGARNVGARAAFETQRKVAQLRRTAGRLLSGVDFLLVPTTPTIPRIADVQADPLRLNAAMGAYTTFVNPLDLAALAVPAGFRADGLPAGVTLVGPWGSDARLAAFGAAIHRATSDRLGALDRPLPAQAASPAEIPAGWIGIAVVGAHLSGEPLNHQLTDLGGQFVRAARTAPAYRLYALPNTTPPKPGLIRAADGGGPVELEIWALSPAAFGAFVAKIPAPLAIGRIALEDGAAVSGFLCEPYAAEGATDITASGGWRRYLGR